jgi:hypothetical protein
MRFRLLLLFLLAVAGATAQPGMYRYNIRLRIKQGNGFDTFQKVIPGQVPATVSDSGKIVSFSSSNYQFILRKKKPDVYPDCVVSFLGDSTTILITYRMRRYSDIKKTGARGRKQFTLTVKEKGGKNKLKPMVVSFGLTLAEGTINLVLNYCAGAKKEVGQLLKPQEETEVKCAE